MGNRSQKEEEVAFDNHKKRYLDIFRQLRTENPDMSIDELEILATDQIVKEAPKSRAFYRIQVRILVEFLNCVYRCVGEILFNWS